MTIYKYTLLANTEHHFSGNKEVVIGIPEGAWFLSVQQQQGAIVAWFAVNPEAVCESRHFYLIGTGFTLPKKSERLDKLLDFLGTVQMHGGSIVVHVFRELN